MIIEAIFNGIYALIELLFGWISLPNFPQELINSINSLFDIIFNNIGIVFLILRPTTVKIAIPILIIILNFDKAYKLIMYIVRKLPIPVE